VASECEFLGQRRNDFLGFEGDGDDFGDELEDVFGVSAARLFIAPGVGVGGDLGAGVGVDLVLVDDPVECGAVAEAIVEGFAGMPARVRESLTRSEVLSLESFILESTRGERGVLGVMISLRGNSLADS
jgi:hypothetical protein